MTVSAKIITNEEITNLVYEAYKSQLRRSRKILHTSHDSFVQAMVICLLEDSKIGMHKHPPGKAEYYSIIQGSIEIKTLSEDNTIHHSRISEEAGSPKIFYTLGDVWHEPRALTEVAIYFEIYTGPFRKENDVEYLSSTD
jgi:cupin fold WbuC family metalloprotein